MNSIDRLLALIPIPKVIKVRQHFSRPVVENIAGVGVPQFKRMAILDITKESHGGANGLGLGDYTTKRAFRKFNFEQTYANSLTTTVTSTAKMPIILKNDKQAIQACIKCSNQEDKANITIVRIKNMLSMEEIEISENLRYYVMEHPQLEVLSEPYTWCFNDDGNFV
ncbi:hypothetical protein [Sporomusa acidovorans]|uniref:Uncharacterized protein n=1 Tax=Sporomusa acidovorans (strain ATCC 49682 / DSM 3132 / Mol) TaxID=1123286 RepID=A0ABZ3IXG4_SPOA4|nr:hypothetical protein [Sporomusa acidovorans]OZC15835.1 hypothetical protein SPACI_46550 [Sporomusa acidovorans DSM 3132]SDF29900.1 hypothetical protein SAMN04488499_104226 [Sporomusa acidovorans]